MIDQQIQGYQADIQDGTGCGVDQNGIIHGPGSRCPNESWNERDETYCPLQKIYTLRDKSDKIRCATQMLEFYWGASSDNDCLTYLENQGFVYSYR